VQIISGEEERQHGLSRGAFSYLVKPATTEALEQAFDRIKDLRRAARASGCWSWRTTRSSAERSSSCGTTTSRSPAVGTGAEALEAAATQPFDCCVLDLRLPDMSGFELLEKVQSDPGAARPADRRLHRQGAERRRGGPRLRTVAKSVVLKDVQSPERLLDETALFLHRVVADLPEPKQRCSSSCTPRTRRCAAEGAGGRRRRAEHLRAHDRARNQEMEVLSAENGRQAIEMLEPRPGSTSC
jgi:CheY-like chemotaxis protein